MTSAPGSDSPAPAARIHPATLPDKVRVLIVDDQHSVALAIASLLASRGYDTITADDGPAALGRLRNEYFDVLLCDLKMPNMSGLDVLSAALDLDGDLPVLMLTGVGDVHSARDALKRGAMDFLTKPIGLDELDQSVGSAARDRRLKIEDQRAAALSAKELELRGGPLGGRKVHLHGSKLRLWVAQKPDGEHVWGASDPATGVPADAHLLGSYGLSADGIALDWVQKAD